MREKYESLFLNSKEGISSSNAGFLKNLGNETVKNNEEDLKGLKFITSTIGLIGTSPDSFTVCEEGRTLEDLQGGEEVIQGNAEILSFVAWIEQALKEKEALIKDVEDTKFSDWAELQTGYKEWAEGKPSIEGRNDYLERILQELGITRKYTKLPEAAKAPTEAEILNGMTIKERADYITTEQMAARYGIAVHPGGFLKTAKDDVHTRLATPVSTTGSGRDMTIKRAVSSLPVETLDTEYDRIQQVQRTWEAKLNRLKAEVKKEIESIFMERQAEVSRLILLYKEDKEAYDHECDKILMDWDKLHEGYLRELDTYERTQRDWQAKFDAWKIGTKAEISRMKIVIPESMKAIWQKLSAAGIQEGIS